MYILIFLNHSSQLLIVCYIAWFNLKCDKIFTMFKKKTKICFYLYTSLHLGILICLYLDKVFGV